MPYLSGEVTSQDIEPLIQIPPKNDVYIPHSAVTIFNNDPISARSRKTIYGFMEKAGVNANKFNPNYNFGDPKFIAVTDMTELDLFLFGRRYARLQNQASLETRWTLKNMAKDTRMDWFGSFIQTEALRMLSEITVD